MLTISIIFALLVRSGGASASPTSIGDSIRRRALRRARVTVLSMPSFGEIVERSLALLQRRGRVSHTALRLEFGLDDETFAALREELVAVLSAADDDGRVLVARAGAAPAAPPPARTRAHASTARRKTPRPPARPAHHRPALRSRRDAAALEALDADARTVVGARFHAICGEVARPARRPRAAVGLRRRRDLLRPSATRSDDDALRAVRCGWEILRTLAAARDVVEREFGLRLERAAGDRDRRRRRRRRRRRPRSATCHARAAAVQDRGAPDRVTVDARPASRRARRSASRRSAATSSR